MSRTTAVVVGVSKYRSSAFDRLQGAVDDAKRFANALRVWGLANENIRELHDRQATRANILEALRVWPLEGADRDLRVIFYFAGHGDIIADPSGDRSVLLARDTSPRDKAGTGVLLSEVIGALSRIRPRQAYIFVDACRQRVDTIYNPLPLPKGEVIEASVPDATCFASILAAGPSLAYESSKSAGGLFTHQLILQMSRLRIRDRRVSSLAKAIRQRLAESGMHPEFSLVGTVDGWPLPAKTEVMQTDRRGLEISRSEAMAKVFDSLSSSSKSLWLRGPSGIGKTVVLKQLSKSVRGVYLQIEPGSPKTAEHVLEQVISQFVEDTPEMFPNGRRPTGDAMPVITKLSKQCPGRVIIIDQVDRLPRSQALSLMKMLNPLTLDVIFASNLRSPSSTAAVSLDAPILSDAEIESFRSCFAADSKFTTAALARLSQRSALHLKSLLSSGIVSTGDLLAQVNIEGVHEAALAIVAARGYVDETLFRKTFQIKISALSWLEENGLISFVNDHYAAHDELLTAVGESTPQLVRQAENYWSAQVLATPLHLWACRLLFSFYEDPGSDRELNKGALEAARTLIEMNDWEPVLRALPALGSSCLKPSEVIIYIAEEAAHIARHDVVNNLIASQRPILHDRNFGLRLDLAEAELCQWVGEYKRVEDLTVKVLRANPKPEIAARAHLISGINLFFQGLWDDALRHLTPTRDSKVTVRTAAWMQMIEGTIYGVRLQGTGVLEQAIQRLNAAHDEVGLAIGWNNLGELRWRTGDPRSALVCLVRALQLCRARGDKATELDVIRNLVNTYLRLGRTKLKEMQEAVDSLLVLLDKVKDATEQMQGWNTLASVSLFEGDLEQAGQYVARARPFTQGNVEYHIYTLFNEAVLEALKGSSGPSRERIRDALRLLVKGGNCLAYRQLRSDLDSLIGVRKNRALVVLKNEFTKVPHHFIKLTERE